MSTEFDDDFEFHARAMGGDDLVPPRKIAPQPMTPETTAMLRDMAKEIGKPRSFADLVAPAFAKFNNPPKPVTDDR